MNEYAYADAVARHLEGLRAELREEIRTALQDAAAATAKAVQDGKWSRNRHIESVEKDLRAEFRREVMELREEVGELVAGVHDAIRRESESRAMEMSTVYNANPTLRTEVE